VEQTQGNRPFLRLIMSLVVLGVVYIGMATFLSRHVPANTTVSGIAIGGMSPGEATVTLQRILATRASQPVHLEGPSRTVNIDPGTAGLEVDLDATLAKLSGFTLSPAELLVHLTGGEDEPLRIRVDQAKLSAAVTEAAGFFDAPVREGSITFTADKPTVVVSVPGRALKVPETTAAVASSWPREQAVTAVMEVLAPRVSATEITRAAREFAAPAMSGPVRVVAGPATVTLRPKQFAPALSLVPDAVGGLAPHADPSILLAAIRAAGPAVERPPVDASVRLVAGAPQVVPAVLGERLDPSTVPATFLTALTARTRVATLQMIQDPPAVTTAAARRWGIKEAISTFTTAFPVNPSRTNNIKIAAGALNGMLVHPGDQFSLNARLGPRTPAKGYQLAPVINGERLEQAYGGGVSQVSTTTFNAAFFSGVRIDRYTPHSFYITRYPEGREATLSWPDVDQQWTNDTGFGILISSFVSGNNLTVTFFGTKTWDVEAVKGPRRNVVQPSSVVDSSPGCVPQSPAPGFDVTVTRVFKKDGAQVKTSTFNTHYAPEDRVQCTPQPFQ
jgi:vancomycin resistance protein YoaR